MYWNEYKTKCVNKNSTNEYGSSPESKFVGVNRFFVLIYLNRDNGIKIFKSRRYCLPKGIIRKYNVIINEKTFYNQLIDSDVKRYKEIRKLTTGKGEDYTNSCL